MDLAATSGRRGRGAPPRWPRLGEAPPDAERWMMGDGSLCPDHLDLLAAPGHEAAVVSLLRDWLVVRVSASLTSRASGPGHSSSKPCPAAFAASPWWWPPSRRPCRQPTGVTGPPCPRSSAEPLCRRQALRGRRRDASGDPGPGSHPPTPRHPARARPVPMGKPRPASFRFRSLRRPDSLVAARPMTVVVHELGNDNLVSHRDRVRGGRRVSCIGAHG